MAERLQKLIAQSGVASRRAAEELIVGGRVRVNGRIIKELGAKADLHHDKVEVDGKRLVTERPAHYLLHKPRAVVTTLDDPEGRDTIADLLRGIPERVFPVGRLDYHTSGAILVTNDGELAQALLHPKKQVPKQYIAKLKGLLEVKELDALRNGVVLDDGYRTKKAELFVMREEGGNTWIHITIFEGKNRQIHRMGMAIGRPVMRLSRVGFAGLTTEGLRPGDYRELYGHEVEKLKKDYVLGAGAAPTPTANSKPKSSTTSKPKPRSKPKSPSRKPAAAPRAATPRAATPRAATKAAPPPRGSKPAATTTTTRDGARKAATTRTVKRGAATRAGAKPPASPRGRVASKPAAGRARTSKPRNA